MSKPATITIEEARVNLSDLARRISIARESFVVTFHGRRMFAMVPLDDAEPAAPVTAKGRRASAKARGQ